MKSDPEIISIRPFFSVITPSFRRCELLRRNIKSLVNQTFDNYEHIIVDDACDSATFNLIKEINDPRIVYLSHSLQQGAAASYNTGIKSSKGSYILFLDDDDEYLPEFLQKVHERFSKKRNDLDFIWTGVTRIKDTRSGEIFLNNLKWPEKFENKENALVAATSIGNGFGLCISRKCIESVGLYDESLKIGSDTDFLFRISENSHFETIPEVLVRIHKHDLSQLTDKDNNSERIIGKEIILRRYEYLLNKYPRLFFTHYRGLADTCYKAGQRRKGRKALFSLIMYSPFRLRTYVDLITYELTGKNLGNTHTGKVLKHLFSN